nr:MAG TPA: hypothetical protein [Caudoviricetes sp.]
MIPISQQQSRKLMLKSLECRQNKRYVLRRVWYDRKRIL